MPRIVLVIGALTALALLAWAAAVLLLVLDHVGSTPAVVSALAVAISVTTAQLAIDYVRRRRTERAVLFIEAAARASQNELIEAVGELARESQSSRARVAALERGVADTTGQLAASMDALTAAVTSQIKSGMNDRPAPAQASQRRRTARRNRGPSQTTSKDTSVVITDPDVVDLTRRIIRRMGD